MMKQEESSKYQIIPPISNCVIAKTQATLLTLGPRTLGRKISLKALF